MRVRLTIHASNRLPRRRLLLPGESLVLGRARGADVRLQDDVVSRSHATIELRGGVVLLTDLGSRNGTFLGPRRLPGNMATPIPPGVIVRLGSHTLSVMHVPEGEDPESRHRFRDAPPLPSKEFEILGEVGVGAVGRVWAARQVPNDRMVAIKELRPELDLDEVDRRRFMREGRLCRTVRSRHVVEVYDVRVVRERPYLIMELVTGWTARDRLAKERALPIPEALQIAEHVAKGLEALAEVGVVHRDVKPQNILLAPGGLAKLGDLGIAKDLLGESSSEGGTGLGTLPYLAPEQADLRRAPIGLETDLYGLGATLFHLVAGRPPFRLGGDAMLTIDAILRSKPAAPRRARPDLPSDVERLILHLLEKDPASRPGSAGWVAQELLALRKRHYPAWTTTIEDSDEEMPVYGGD